MIDGEFIFDGTDRIATSVESFYPCTVEAWIATEDHGRAQFVIGSDTPNQWGIGMGIRKSNPMVKTIGGGFHVPEKEFRLGEWSHVAAVFDLAETRLYFNGNQTIDQSGNGNDGLRQSK